MNHRKPCPSQNFKNISPNLRLNKKHKMLYIPLQIDHFENQGLLDTGAIQSDLSEAELRKILHDNPEAFLSDLPLPKFKEQIANGNLDPKTMEKR